MDEMGEKLRAQGFRSRVINHTGWQGAADRMAAYYRMGRTSPIISSVTHSAPMTRLAWRTG